MTQITSHSPELDAAMERMKPVYRLENTSFASISGARSVFSAPELNDETEAYTNDFWEKVGNSLNSQTQESIDSWRNLEGLLLSTLDNQQTTEEKVFANEQSLRVVAGAYGDFILAKNTKEKVGAIKTTTEKKEGWLRYIKAIEKLESLHSEIVGKGYITATSYYPNQILQSKPITRNVDDPSRGHLMDISLEHELAAWKEFAERIIYDLDLELEKSHRTTTGKTFAQSFIRSLASCMRKLNLPDNYLETLKKDLAVTTLVHFVSLFCDTDVSYRSVANWKRELFTKLENST